MTAITVSLNELLDALLVAEATRGDDEHGAWMCRATGEIVVSLEDFEDEAPDDLHDEARYLRVPSKWDLDLNSHLALRFAEAKLPDDFDTVRDFFHRRGAYRAFRHLVERRGALDRWYAYEEAETRAALRVWAQENGLVVREDALPAAPPG